MNKLILHQFISMYIILFIYEFMIYAIMCHCYPLKTTKIRAYLFAFLCSCFVPINNTLSNIYLGGGIIPETQYVILFNNFIMVLEQVILLIFIIKVIDIVWYQSYWLTILLSAILVPPYQLIYYNLFTDMNADYDVIIQPVTLDNLPKYLLIFVISIAWGLFILYLCRYLKKAKKVNQISKWSWFALYSIYVLIILNTDRQYHIQKEDIAKIWRGGDNYRQLIFLVIAVAIIMFLSISYADKKLLKVENNLLKEQIEIQYNNYLLLQQQEMKIHKLYHDIGNHINTIQVLVSNGENLEAKSYTESLAQQYQNIKKDYYSNNKIINAVLTEKTKICTQSGITYDIDISIPETLPIQDIDLMSVYSNLLDNAIEGCQRNNSTNNYIKVKTSVIGDYLAIKIVNSKSAEITSKTDKFNFTTWKKDKSMHGYGIRILEEIVNRYNGQKELLDNGIEFSAMVMLKAK